MAGFCGDMEVNCTHPLENVEYRNAPFILQEHVKVLSVGDPVSWSASVLLKFLGGQLLAVSARL